MTSETETYEGDYRCDVSEGPDDPCRSVATKVFREPYTPGSFPVAVCDEHAGGPAGYGYRFDAEATAQLGGNVEWEAALFAAMDSKEGG
jgi:hypothetical protein